MHTSTEPLHADDVTAFVAAALGDRRRVLEVGCGRGAVARRLAALGYEVTALDLVLRDLEPGAAAVRFVEGDFLAFTDAGFDAIAFTSSLHHIAPLDRAVEHAASLLRPGGRLVADDFDLDAPDDATLRWYYDAQELLRAADLYPADHLDEPAPSASSRWHHAHHHDTPLHTAAAMLAALASRFTILEAVRGPYLHRYIAGHLPSGERGARIAAHLRSVEQTGIVDGRFRAVGLRIVADARLL